MNHNQLSTMIQRYIQDGKDIETFWGDYQALLASGKTPIGLNQWVKTDKPMMEDFNEDNRVIDAAIRELEEKKADRQSPQSYPLPLKEGYVAGYPCYYYKSQENIVTIYGTVDKATFIGNGEIIATLPEGYRIGTTVEYPITCISGNTFYPATVRVKTNGEVESRITNSSITRAYFAISYVASK